jgi:hypothetical protein
VALERAPAAKFGKPEDLQRFRPAPKSVRLYHTVASKDQSLSWIANQYHVPVAQLFGLNFPGSVENGRIIPEVVNWYLNHHEQFRCPETVDKKNRIFKGGEKIAIPGEFVDVEDPLEIVVPAKPLNIWAGGGYKIGTTFGVVGNETGQIACVSLDDATRGFTASVTGTRLGVGVGASGGPLVVIVASMPRAGGLRGMQTGGWGYNIAVGPKLNGVLRNPKVAGAIKALIEYAEKVKKMGRAGAAAVKAGAALAKYNSQIVDAVKMLGMDTDAIEPQVLTLDVPVGGFGAELSVVHTVTTFHVEYSSD